MAEFKSREARPIFTTTWPGVLMVILDRNWSRGIRIGAGVARTEVVNNLVHGGIQIEGGEANIHHNLARRLDGYFRSELEPWNSNRGRRCSNRGGEQPGAWRNSNRGRRGQYSPQPGQAS